MAVNFYDFLKNKDNTQRDMPPIRISKRNTDIYDIYNKNNTRLDVFAGNYYGDEKLWRVILWANPDYVYEYDIPDGTIIRIPKPIDTVIQEIIDQIVKNS